MIFFIKNLKTLAQIEIACSFHCSIELTFIKLFDINTKILGKSIIKHFVKREDCNSKNINVVHFNGVFDFDFEQSVSSRVCRTISCSSFLEDTCFKNRSSRRQKLVLLFRRNLHTWICFRAGEAKAHITCTNFPWLLNKTLCSTNSPWHCFVSFKDNRFFKDEFFQL